MAWFGKKVLQVQLEANVTWLCHRDPETGSVLGVCRELNLNAAGDTWREFQDAANEAMQLLLLDLFEDGELAGFLRLNGWRPRGELPPPGTRPEFDIPFNIVQRNRFEELVPA